MAEQDAFTEWLKQGIEAGWCGPAVCYTHDGLPMSEAEFTDEFDDQVCDEPCIHVLRLYPDAETKQAVEEYHSPSNWRKPQSTN